MPVHEILEPPQPVFLSPSPSHFMPRGTGFENQVRTNAPEPNRSSQKFGARHWRASDDPSSLSGDIT